MRTPDHQGISRPIHREEDARRLLETSFDGVWAIDSELRTTFVNARMAEMLGYSPQEMQGKRLFDFLFPEDLPVEEQAIARRKLGVREEFEIRYRRKDGSEFWARVAAAPILSDGGAFQGAVAIHSDISRRRSTEEALHERERELRRAERLAQIGSWEWFPDTDTIVWSEGLYCIAGRDPSTPAVSYKDHRQLYTADSWAQLDAAVRQALAHGTPYELDLELVRPDGSTRWVVVRGEALRDQKGRLWQLRGTVQDITERKRAEQVSERLAAIVESSDDAIISKDLNGIITSWNTAAMRMFGYAPEEAIGKSILLLIPPELHADEDEILRRLRAGQRIEHFHTQRVKKSGERIDVSLTISPVRDPSGRIVGASKIARDISDRRRAEQALLTSEKLATVGRLAATVAHEINNPLEAVINLVFLAKAAVRNSAAQRYLGLAQEELNRIAHLTKQTLTFYRARSERTRARAGALLHELVAVFSSKAQNKSIRITVEVADDPEILVDVTEFRQLFANLISNSIDACKAGGSIRVRTSTWAGALRVTVADNGSGIQPENRPRLFEPFFTTKKDVGTGLGLWICKQIAEKYGGSIRLRSSVQPGRSWTVVSVLLPVTVAEAGRLAAPASGRALKNIA